MRKLVFIAAASLLVVAASCSSSKGEKQETTKKTVAKGDCPDCDPSGPSAFEQANMGLRFYLEGDSWEVAYQFKERSDMLREGIRPVQLPDDPTEFQAAQVDQRVALTEPFLFHYEVTKVDKRVIDNVQRQVARISVTQAVPLDAQLFSMQRLDTHEYRLEFELDDLLRPLSETFYNFQYPHGKTIEVDKESALSTLTSGSNLFPHAIPRVLTTGKEVVAPTMTPELEAIADSLIPGWRDKTYLKFEFENGDLVYWAKGQLWPFYTVTEQGYGLLVSQNLIQR